MIAGGLPNGWLCFGWLRNGALSIRVGCREKRIDEALAYWNRPEKLNRREVVAAVRYIEAVALIRGWKIHADEMLQPSGTRIKQSTITD